MTEQNQRTSNIPSKFRTTIAIIENAWGKTSDEWGLMGHVAEEGSDEEVEFVYTDLVPATGPGPNFHLTRNTGADSEWYVALDAIFPWQEVRDIYYATPADLRDAVSSAPVDTWD